MKYGRGVPQWINRLGAQPPAWVTPHVVGAIEANGTFLIRTLCGREKANARVLVGNVVFERGGVAYTGTRHDAAILLAQLIEASAVWAPAGPTRRGRSSVERRAEMKRARGG